MVAKPLCPLYKNIIKPLDRARYPELRYKPYQFLDSYVLSDDSLLSILGSVWLLWNSCDKIISKILVGLDSH